MHKPFDTISLLLGIYPTDILIYKTKGNNTHILFAGLFVIAKVWQWMYDNRRVIK